MSVSPPHFRPRIVTLLIWGVFFIGSWNAGRTLAVTRQIDVLVSLEVRPDPRLQIVMAASWAIMFWGLSWGLWRKRPFTRRAIPLLLTLYALFELSIQRHFAQSLNPQSWNLLLTLFVIAILITTWGLNRPATKFYFENQNQGIMHQGKS